MAVLFTGVDGVVVVGAEAFTDDPDLRLDEDDRDAVNLQEKGYLHSINYIYFLSCPKPQLDIQNQ